MKGCNVFWRGSLALFMAAMLHVLMPPGPSNAQSGDDGVLNAVAYRPLPRDVPIAVRPLDNSDSNLVMQREFEQRLRALGYVVRPDGPLILSFDTRDDIGSWSDDGRRTVLELEGRGGVIGGDSARARLNLFDSDRGGIMNEGRRSGTNIVTPSRYRLDASIDERQSGERLWQAWATAELQQSSGAALTKAMVPGLLQSLGTTVKNRAITFD